MRTDDARWEAVCARDRSADDAFIYAVVTTGVACRPSCPSRRALRRNVRFFDDLDQAVAAGYRPCLRCRPDRPASRNAHVVRACTLLDAGAATTIEVAASLGISASYLTRLFKRELGVTPQQYRRRRHTERARERLTDEASVGDAIFAAGYPSASRFYEGLGQELGMTPRETQGKASGKLIYYHTTTCSLGPVLIAWTQAGVCRVDLGPSEVMFEALQARFAKAELVASADGPWIELVVETLDGRASPTLPLDFRGTAFQEQVWQVLREIPPGEVRSYTEIAQALGKPRGARAVARACATNEVAVVVPCHRVVRSDGQLAGYRWGLDLKRQLLHREASTEEQTSLWLGR
ncbi:MAG: bifunctional DNA-binding transcriptional regulator/O6-methylguanine-DNA methyltransferase Ada [Myxococcota bacterium]